MANVTKFEDLIVWQKARLLCREIYILTARDEFRKDYNLVNQLRRAAISVVSNIAEGFDRTGDREFHHFLVIAKGSCAEVRAQLYIAQDVDLISHSEFRQLRDQALEVSRIINSLRAHLQNKIKRVK